MDIKKLKEELAKMPKYGFKGNMFVGKKKPEPKTPIIKELAKELGIPVKEYKLPDLSDFGDVIEGLPEIDEISINGITGETFTNGENN